MPRSVPAGSASTVAAPARPSGTASPASRVPAAQARALPPVDVSINVEGPAQAMATEQFSYTVTVSNNSLNDADGSTFTNAVPSAATGVTATCTAAGGARCPDQLSVSDTTVGGTVPTLPHLGTVVVVVRGAFGRVSPSSVTDAAHVDPPAGVTDTDPSSNDSSVSTTVMPWVADLAVTLEQSSDTFDDQGTDVFTATLRNLGPVAADGAGLALQFDLVNSPAYTDVRYTVESCTATGGAECPSSTPGSGSGSWSATVGALPAGASVTVTLRATLSDPSGCTSRTGRLRTVLSSVSPADVSDPSSANNRAEATTTTPAPPSCRLADLQVQQTTDTVSLAPETPVDFTVVLTNAGPGATSGFTYVQPYVFGFTGSYVYSLELEATACTSDAGASCPDDFVGTHSTTGQLNLYVDSFEPGATLTFGYRVTPHLVPPGCSSTNGYLYSSVYAQVGSGVTDPVPGNNGAVGLVPAPAPRPCPAADLGVQVTASAGTISSLSPVTYTMTVTNQGPGDADGASLYQNSNLYNPSGGEGPAVPTAYNDQRLEVVSCTGEGGVACPDFILHPAGGSGFGNGRLGAFPSGAVLTVVYRVSLDFVPDRGCGSTLSQSASVSPASGTADPVAADDYASLPTPIACRDVSVNQTVMPSAVRALQPFALASTVSLAGGDAVHGVRFSTVLPAGLVYVDSTCAVVSAGSVCGDVAYDPGTRTVSSVVDTVVGAGVRITVDGTSGPVPGTYRSTAAAVSGPGTDAYDDPVPASDRSTVTLQVNNTASRITVTKQVTGLPDGVPRATTFTGQVTCGTQGSQPWSATVPARGTTATSASLTFYDGEPCAVTEDAPPAAPTGYHYTGPAAIDPSRVDRLGDSQRLTVTSTSVLALTGRLSLTSSVSNPLTGPGAAVSYTVTLTNTGPVAASGLTLDAGLPLGLTGPTASDGGVAAGGRATWTGLVLAPGESLTRTVSGTAGPLTVGDLTVSFSVGDPEGFDPVDVDAGCDDDPTRSCASTRVTDVGALRLTHTVDPGTVDPVTTDPGPEVTFDLTVENVGTRDADGVVVTDRLPAGLCGVTASDGGVVTAETGCGPTVVTWPAGAVPVGGSVEHEVVATVADGSTDVGLTAAFTIGDPTGFEPVVVDDVSTCTGQDDQSEAACATVQVLAEDATDPETPATPVEGTTAGGSTTGDPHPGSHLASTGGPSAVLLGLAVVGTVGGTLLVGAGRRRRRSARPS